MTWGLKPPQRMSQSDGEAMAPRAGGLPRLVMFAAVSATVALLAMPVTAAAAAIDATPPSGCNGTVGVLATPQSLDTGGNPLLTKALTNTVPGTGSTTYFYLITTNRPSTSTFTHLLDCAYSTQTGTPLTATYGTQQSPPGFLNGQLTITLTVNGNDSVCDRVLLQGTDPSNTAFNDYSNLAAAPSGTTCLPIPAVPETPATGLLLVSAGALSAAWFVRRQRGRRPLEPR